MTEEPLISIVIPVKNGAPWLEKLFQAIGRQTLAHRTETIVVDSGSRDESLAIAGRYPVRVLSIDPASFDHGLTRNLGAEAARGEYIVMTVQDALPADDRWLEKLLAGFDDENVAGVCGQQVVPHDPAMNPVQWFRPVSAPRLTRHFFASPAEFRQLSPREKRQVCAFDNVNAMYRRETLLRTPFRQVGFAEDAQWAIDTLLAGNALVYNDAARVYHYHFETAEFTYKRTFTENYYIYRMLGYVETADNLLVALLRDANILRKEKEIRLREKFKWLLYNYRIRSSYARAIRDFKRFLGRGEKILEREHERICGVPPQAPKP